MRRPSPLSLIGATVRLEPLDPAHAPALVQAGADASIWTHMVYGIVDSLPAMQAMIADLLARQAAGTDLPFVVVHRHEQRPIGMTRFMDIQPDNAALEIGGTWYTPAHQGSAVNTECKLLLLRHVFEALGGNRVQFKTDVNNLRSQRAIERLGAVREGVLREHWRLPDGRLRSSVYYSILAREWPDVRARLEQRLHELIGV